MEIGILEYETNLTEEQILDKIKTHTKLYDDYTSPMLLGNISHEIKEDGIYLYELGWRGHLYLTVIEIAENYDKTKIRCKYDNSPGGMIELLVVLGIMLVFLLIYLKIPQSQSPFLKLQVIFMGILIIPLVFAGLFHKDEAFHNKHRDSKIKKFIETVLEASQTK